MLYDIQSAFIQSVLDDSADAIEPYVCGSGRLSAVERFSVYRGSIRGGQVKALRDSFPVCKALVGEQCFDEMAALYILNNPSHSSNIKTIGRVFADFVCEFTPLASLPYLGDVARLEWARQQAYHAPAGQPLTEVALIAGLKAGKDLVYQLQPSGQLLTSSYPVHRIWTIHQPDYRGEFEVDLDAQGDRLLIWRQDLTLRMDSLKQDEWTVLTAITQPTGIGQLIERLPNLSAEALFNMLCHGARRGWINQGGVVDEYDSSFVSRI